MSGESSAVSPTKFSVRNILDKLRYVGFSSANWRELGQRLTPGSDFDAIEKDYPSDSHQCLERVIDEWKRNGDRPSWKTAAEAVSQCRGGGVNVANDLLLIVGFEPEQPVDALSTPSSSQQSHSEGSQSNSGSILGKRSTRQESHELSVDSPPEMKQRLTSASQQSYRERPDDTALGSSSSEQKSDVRGAANVHEKYKKMFGELVRKTRDGVLGMGVNDVVDQIVEVASGKGERDRNYFDAHADTLRRSESVRAVFDRVRQHWDYLHPEIYEGLIQEIPLPDLDPVQTKYQTALDLFLDQTSVSEFCAIQGIVEERKGDPPQGFTVCVTQHRWDPEEISLRVIENFRKRFASCCNLQSCAVTFVEIKSGSICVVFCVPGSTNWKPASDIKFIVDHSIISINFNGHVVVHHQKGKITVMNLDKADTMRQSTRRVISGSENKYGMLLTQAVEKEDMQEVQKLIADGANLNPLTDCTPLKMAVGRENVELTAVLLKNGADPNLVTDNWTPLMKASRMGQSAIVELLVETGGADPNTINGSGWTALMTASNRGDYNTVDYLLQRKADPNMQDYDGWSALLAAVYMGHERIALKLIEGGATPRIQDKNNTSPLMLAIVEREEKVVDALLKLKPDLDLRDKWGQTALLLACKVGNLYFVKELLSMGADPNISNIDGETPIFIANVRKHSEMIKT